MFVLRGFNIVKKQKRVNDEKSYMGVPLTTFIIGKDSTIEKIIEKEKTKEYTKQIFEELE